MSAIESAPPKAKLYPVVTIQITSLAIPTITPLGTNVADAMNESTEAII